MCNCIEETDKLLAPKGFELIVAFSFPEGTQSTVVATQRITKPKRGEPKHITLMPTFCPFCGEKLPVGGIRTAETENLEMREASGFPQ